MYHSSFWLRPIYVVLLAACAGTVLFLSAMDRDLNHDEHQFLAPGVLISRMGLQPYRDFPMFHLPNLAITYAAANQLIPSPILAAKVVNTGASVLLVAFLAIVATRRIDHPSALSSYLVGAGAVLLLLYDQLFAFTAGKTWNHELPAFLVVAAICFQGWASCENRSVGMVIPGFLTGAAIGTRLTYAPVAIVLLSLAVFGQKSGHAQWKAGLSWILGATIGLGPSLYFFFQSPDAFLFDNLRFPRLRLLDLSDTRVQETSTLWRKLRFFFKEIVVFSLPLFAAAALLSWKKVRQGLSELRSSDPTLLLALATLPAVILGCFLPSRYQYQHYYGVAPLLALIIALGASQRDRPSMRWPLIGLGACVLLSMSGMPGNGKRNAGWRTYLGISSMWNNDDWFSKRLASTFAKTKGLTPVATLAPAGVLEAGGMIYPEFATGPFAWRGAGNVSQQQRQNYRLLVPADLSTLLSVTPPAALLTGVEDAPLEEPLVQWANEHQFRPEKLSKKRILWLPSKKDHP